MHPPAPNMQKPQAVPRRWWLTSSPINVRGLFLAVLVLAVANAFVSSSSHQDTHPNPLVRLGTWLGLNMVSVVVFTLLALVLRSFQHAHPPSAELRALVVSYGSYLLMGLVAGAVRYEVMVQLGLAAPSDTVVGSVLAYTSHIGVGGLLAGLVVNQYQGFMARALEQQRMLEYQLARLESAVAARAEAEARFASLVGAVPDAVVIVDDASRVMMWNAGAERTFGYSAAEAVGASTSIFVPQRLSAQYAGMVEAAQGPSTFELTALCKGGAEIPIAVSIARWESGGRRWLGAIARDISNERAAQEREARDQRLAALGQLAAGMAHDFCNVLTSILTANSLLQEASDDQMCARLHALVERSGHEGAALANRVMEFSRRTPLELEQVEMTALVRESLPGIEQQVRAGVSVFFEDPAQEMWVKADAPLLRQVLVNLARNGSDAMTEGGGPHPAPLAPPATLRRRGLAPVGHHRGGRPGAGHPR